MYKYSKEQVLDPAFLTKLIAKFKREYIPRYQKDQRYYEVKTKVLERTMEDGKPNNKLAHGFCRYISNMATSYFAGKPVRINFPEKQKEYEDAVLDVFKNNYIDSLNFEVSKEASKKGIGFYLMFVNENTKIRIKKMNAESIIPIYSQSLDEFLETAVHIWSVYDIDDTLVCEYADVYDEKYIYHYRRQSGEMEYKVYEEKEEHNLCDIPVIVVWNNEDCQGDYEPIITLNDGYDSAQSDTANDIDYFSDAYLCIAGASDIMEDSLASEEEKNSHAAANLRKDRILFLDEQGQADWLIKNTNDTATENYKSRLYKDIFFLSQVPSLSDENFAGNLSGIAIKYKMTGLEELAIQKENYARSAMKKMIKIITEFFNTYMNKNWNAKEVEFKFSRNFIENVSDMIADCRNLENVVSRRTQLNMLPSEIVPNVQEELEKMEEEKLQEENLPMVSLESL